MEEGGNSVFEVVRTCIIPGVVDVHHRGVVHHTGMACLMHATVEVHPVFFLREWLVP